MAAMSRRRAREDRQAADQPALETEVASLSHEGRGIAQIDGKITFIDFALPGERVAIRHTRRRGRFDEARVETVITPSPDRVDPPCPHFGVCGGCSLQHLAPAAQIAHKQSVLLEHLAHIGKAAPERVLEPLTSATRGYRRRARLSARYVPGKGGVVVGFRERSTPYVAALESCDILPPALGALIRPLRELVTALSIRTRVPQVEVTATDEAIALVLRHLLPLSAGDEALLASFARAHGVDLYLQPGGNDSVHAFGSAAPRPLRYALPAHGVEIEFGPLDFTQINFEINRAMVDRVVDLLAPRTTDTVLDLFCGVGNFSLPLARRAGRVIGVEGEARLVERARANAVRNGIGNAEFTAGDLGGMPRALRTAGAGKWLLDPPRSGAEALLREADLAGVGRLVYVSCNPATLARDAGILVNERGLRLVAAGVMDMFPHTAHVESIALFEPR
ncbi:MAG: 23S rRNA (uracil(1939)-C(5))-methyltransferase RlmD [Gammaproteobacteria bacterium]